VLHSLYLPSSVFQEKWIYGGLFSWFSGTMANHINGKPEYCISIFLDKWLSVFPFIQKAGKLEKKQSRNTAFQRARYMEKQEAILLYNWQTI